ncbi:MAG: hypothetical protein WBE26_16325 [Phycisphaerae bacterium]
MKSLCVWWWGWSVTGLLVGAALLVGCHGGKRIDPVSIANPMLGPLAVAVAPALNLSGSADFDRDRFADLMASELSYADGISVIPVSRVLGVLAVQGLNGVESPTHALELVGLLGADAILVFAVTEYDPYDPPSIGISAQLYGARPGPGGGALDPVALSRQAVLAASGASASPRRLLAQTERVFDASHGSVVTEIREFAKHRGSDDTPYGWRKHVVSQQHFIRYCCHATIRALLSGPPEPVVAGVDRKR